MKSEIFTAGERALLESIGTPMRIRPREIIYLQGDDANRIYYIRRGRVRVFQNTAAGREVTLDVVEAGHIIGESAFAANHQRPACLQAVNDVQLSSFRAEDLLPHFQTTPALALHLLEHCSNTMDRLVCRMQEQCLLNRYGKVASFILDLTTEDSPELGAIDGAIPYTHENIADSLGLNRTTVTEILRDFEKKGWVRCGYRRVQVLNRDGLIDFVRRQWEQ